jgi:hypothetical protein
MRKTSMVDKRRVAPIASSAKGSKALIRRNVMEALGEPAHVFDAFAGTGEFYREVWKDAASYVGCDLRYFTDDRAAYVADNRRVLRAIDLSRFNLFDLDAYGMPWEQAIIIAARRRIKAGERIGFVFTEGGGLTYKNNIVPRSVANLTGLSHDKAVGLFRRRTDIHSAIVSALAKRMQAKVTARWQGIGRAGTNVAYIGLVLEAASGVAARVRGSGNRVASRAVNPS